MYIEAFLKALCSVLVTTKIESPVQMKHASGSSQIPEIPRTGTPPTWGCLTANLKKHDVLRLERGSTPQVNSGLSQVRLRVCTLSRGSRVSGDRKGGFYYHFPTSLRINGEKKKPSVWTPTSASFFHERKIRKSDVSLLAPTKIQLHKKRTPFLT